MVVVYTADENGSLQVHVNPKTGRIYSFSPANTPLSIEPNDETQVVKVNASIDEFANEVSNGLFYKDGLFLRGIMPKAATLFDYVGNPNVLQFTLPEPADTVLDYKIYKDGTVVNEGKLASQQGKLELHYKFDEPGTYKVVVESDEFGRSSVQIIVNVRIESRVVKAVKQGDVKSALAQLPTITSGLNDQLNGLSQQTLLNSAQEYLKDLPEPMRKKVLEQLKEQLKNINGDISI